VQEVTLFEAVWNFLKDAAPVATLLTTVIYVILTSKLVHSSHAAHLRPVSVNTKDRSWLIKIQNFGPGIATNVKVETVVMTDFVFDPTQPQSLMGWETRDIKIANGPFEIQPNVEAVYEFKYLMSFKEPFFISWKTVTGKKLKNAWLIKIGHNDEVVPLKPSDYIHHLVGQLVLKIKSPFVKAQIWWKFKKEKRKIK
jgi:hypothetical protein